MENILFESEGKKKKRLRNEAICREFKSLMSVEGRSKLKVIEYLCKKYDFASPSSIYSVLKRAGLNGNKKI